MSNNGLYNEGVKRELKTMFEKLFNTFFVKTVKRTGITVISAKREIKPTENADISRAIRAERSEEFWNNRGRAYGALFTSLNGRIF